MHPTVSRDDAVQSWPADRPVSAPRNRADDLERSIRTFLKLSTALALSDNEQRTLLDLSACDMTLLRLAPSAAFQLGRAKLERRVAYAVPILGRMLAALS